MAIVFILLFTVLTSQEDFVNKFEKMVYDFGIWREKCRKNKILSVFFAIFILIFYVSWSYFELKLIIGF